MRVEHVEWSLGKDPEVVIEIWSTAALMEGVIAALLDHPEGLAKAREPFRRGG